MPRACACGLLFVALVGLFGSADAAICKYVARDGRVTYSNLGTGPSGASKVECFETPAPVSVPPTTTDTDEAEQTNADAQDRSALEQQLADEEERLEQAQRELSEQQANLNDEGDPYYYDSLGPYVDAVTIHRRSRDRIRRELAEHRRGRMRSHDAHHDTPASRPPRENSGGTALFYGRPEGGSKADRPEHHRAAGFGQHRGGLAGSHSESGLGRR